MRRNAPQDGRMKYLMLLIGIIGLVTYIFVSGPKAVTDAAVSMPNRREQVWDAIATGRGISAWFLLTDLEEREGGAVCFHMGADQESRGSVTGLEPPRSWLFEEIGRVSKKREQRRRVEAIRRERLERTR